LKKEETGRAMPVNATTTRKKKTQRGKRNGSVKLNSTNNPPHPIASNNRDVGKKENGDGVPAGFIAARAL
jgi:hypothetical protein